METKVKQFLSLAICIAAARVWADLDVVSENVQENFSETVKASGKFHMGLQYSGKHDFDSLYVNLPKKSAGTLCVKMASIDGLYKARLRYEIATPIGGWTKVNFVSRYEKELSSLGVNELALLATLGDDCDATDRKVLVSSWSADTSEAIPVIIIRSSLRLDVAHVPNVDDSTTRFKCKEFERPNTATFDKYCEIDRAAFLGAKTIEIQRVKFKRPSFETIAISR